ncbi:MAG: nitroreductase family protein [Ignavibacteria bacterium]|nr:nitroreductase family protein [Ignavibacteria bacterium]
MNSEFRFIPYRQPEMSEDERIERAEDFYLLMNRRRSIREFSGKEVDRKLIELAVRTAGTAPSGANKQPWRYIIVSDPDLKREIRSAAEKEEKENYERRMPKEWLDDLKQFGTDWHKDFIETAPFVVVVFRIDYMNDDGSVKKHYYVNESVGISVGIFIAALQNMGLVTLTHTPSPMNFLSKILKRPSNERAFLLMPVGYPADEASVPEIKRKSPDEIMEFL